MAEPETSPEAPDDIDRAWLASLLAPGASIETLRWEPVGDGLLNTVVRLHLEWNPPTAGPETVVAKLPSALETNRMINRQFTYDEREVGTYRSLASGIAGLTPRCHHASTTANGACLVLDDLRDHKAADQLAGATAAEADAVANAAAHLHARNWNSPALDEAEFLPRPSSPLIAGYEDLFEMMWEPFTAMIGDSVTPAQTERATDAMAGFGQVVTEFEERPMTLVHGDLRLENVMFHGVTGEATLIDWQLASRGRGAYDLAFFVAGSVEPHDIDRAHRLVERYHDTLVRAGVEGYDRDECWLDFCRGHILNLPNPVTALVAVQTTDERGAALLRVNAQRALRWLELLDVSSDTVASTT